MWGGFPPPVYATPTDRRFSRTELRHITIAFGVLTFDLWLIFDGLNAFSYGAYYGSGFSSAVGLSLLLGAGVAALAAVTGFLAHEMGHKFAAQHLGLWAEFRAFWNGLLISVLFSALGFLFAAPGATYIAGRGDRRESGLTSVAGPLVNLGEAGVLLSSAWVLGRSGTSLAYPALLLVGAINVYWALFNLIPYGPLDGAKVLRWSKPIWAVLFAGSLVWVVSLYLLTGVL